MLAAEAVQHHSEVLDRERQLFVAGSGDFVDDLPEWSDVRYTLQILQKRSFKQSEHYCHVHTVPRLSLALIEEAYTDLTEEDDEQSGDTYRSPETIEQLKAFVSDTLLPISGVRLEPATAQGALVMGNISVCEAAEKNFANTLRQINTDQPREQEAISVYHDVAGRPIVLRKSHETSIAVTLEALNIGGLVIPAGTFGRVGNDMNRHVSGTNHDDLTSYLVEGAFSFGPSRIGVWAYASAKDRSSFAISVDQSTREFMYDPYRGRTVEDLALKDFKAAGRRVMEKCEVEQCLLFNAGTQGS